VKDLEQQVKLLERKIELQAAILESIGDVNRVLASDDEGKKLLWTNGYPHNLKPEIAEKIQQILKKKRSRGGGKAALLRHVLAPGSELPK
jgi:hypothetical protein